MAIRKEQVLALLTLGIVALSARGYLEEPNWSTKTNTKVKEYQAKPFLATTLVTTPPVALARGDFLSEPSETKSLPPRELAFPPRSPLSLAAMPLDPGPDFGHLYAVRVDGAPLEGIAVAQSGDAAPVEATPTDGEPAPVTTSRKEQEERAARSYDRVYYGGLASPRFGTIDRDGIDVFALETSADLSAVQLRLRTYDVVKQRVGDMMTLGGDNLKIDRIELAGTLRNEIARRERKIPESLISLPDRRDFITWLLERAREDTTVYDKALQHADLYRQLSGGDIEGLRQQQRVLRARGDLAGELAMLEGLPLTGPNASFRFEGLGAIKARLGLMVEAEADLRHAVSLQMSDARPHAALAEFLRQRGRSREALTAARATEQRLGSVQDASEKVRILRTIVSCQLAMGRVDDARATLATMQDAPQPYLEACVHYAAGNATAAFEAFRNAGSTADSGAAQLGQAAALMHQAKVQEAHDLLLRVYDQEPLLRHRAATGLAWLFLRTKQYESAIVWIDRALEADPLDPFAFYLRGRTLRLSGQLESAVEALEAALRLRDDFVHAIAEMAAVQSERAREGRGDAQVAAAVAARRYGDRAVDLVATPSLELYELQGLYRFDAADVRAASTAFSTGRDFASDDKLKWYGKGALAVVDYSRGRVDEAWTSLNRMTQDLAKDEPLAKWAQESLAAIDDHAAKETLGDSLDRSEHGAIWTCDSDGPLGAEVVAGQLAFRRNFPRGGKGEVFAERVGAVRKGKNFLATSATLQLGPKQPRADSFAGLGIELQRGNGGVEFQVRVGVREGKPHVRLVDGRDNGQEVLEKKDLEVVGFDVNARHELELRVVQHGEEQQKQFTLVVAWNGLVVYRRDLKTLTGNTNTELKTVLFASGRSGDDVDVAFDDYRLERRKDR